jgi:putative FmdB family regulatory protein
MATYGYRCSDHGSFDLVRPIGTAPVSAGCPECGGPGRRTWTAPRLSAADPRRMALIDATKASADRPEVVTSPPRRPARDPRSSAVQRNPALGRLPRP